MADISAFLDFWRNAPRSTFEAFRDRAVALMEATACAHNIAKQRVTENSHAMPVIHAITMCNRQFEELKRLLVDAREIWEVTPIHRYLTRTEPVIVREGISTRFDGCCYHDVALNFGEHLLESAWNMECGNYFTMVRSATGRKAFAGDYLRSLVAQIRSECQAGIEKWKEETGKLDQQPNPIANEGNGNKLFPGGVPDDPDLVDLAARLNSAKGTGRKQLDVARELTGETAGEDEKAKRLLARLRMMKKRGKLNL